jgi:acetyl esterase/lipase
VVAALDYPTTQPRRQVEPAAVARAMARLRTMPGVDRRRVVLWGESAGAHLALLTAMTRLRSAPGVAAVVSVSGPTDLRTEYASGAQVFLRAVRRFEQMTPVDAAVRADDRYTVTSPVAVVPAAPPPVFQAVSVLDPLVPTAQVSELARVLDRRGVEHRTVLVAGTAHGLDLEAQRTATGAGRVDDAAIAFVRHALGR